MNVILLGAPGAGKGTQARLLEEALAIPHISTGEIFRRALKEKTPLGREVEKHLKAGTLVPDEIVVQVVKERLDSPDCARGYILDGSPRTQGQAEALDRMLKDPRRTIDCVVNIAVDEEELVRRLTGRRACSECGRAYHLRFSPPKKEGRCDVCGAVLFQRDDDKEEVVRHRLEVYRKETAPLVEYYRRKGLLKEVNGAGEVEQIYARLLGLVKGSA